MTREILSCDPIKILDGNTEENGEERCWNFSKARKGCTPEESSVRKQVRAHEPRVKLKTSKSNQAKATFRSPISQPDKT